DFEEVERILKDAEKLKISEFGDDLDELIKLLTLETLDNKWVDHLEVMKGVREGIHLQGYAQRDPLVEYKNQAFDIFESFINGVNSDIARKFFRVQKVRKEQEVAPRIVETNVSQIENVLTGDREFEPDDSGTDKLDNVI